MDVYIHWLKDFSGKQIYDIDDKDVLDFLIFKDVNNSGRTLVHHNACPNVGLTHLELCQDKVKCSLRHSATSKGDPTRSLLVQKYIGFKHMEQGEAGVLNKSAPKISYLK